MADLYWARPIEELLTELGVDVTGLSSDEAAARKRRYGPNIFQRQRRLSRVSVLLNQLRSPLLLLLVLAALISGATREWVDAGIVVTIVAASVLLGCTREYSAQAAANALKQRMGRRTRAVRDGSVVEVANEDIVPGDIVVLAAGSLIPADSRLLEGVDCYVSEAVLTGESFPVEKTPGNLSAATTLRERSNCLFLGSDVRSGSARAVVIATGPNTQYAGIARRLSSRPPDTEFDRGLRRFGYLLTSAMFVLVVAVVAAHAVQGRPALDTLLFAIALAVGLSPELLPAILSLNLARSARSMASRGVLVRRLNAIENLGSMDLLCTDKTGTLTEGVIGLDGSFDAAGVPDDGVLEFAAINATLETGPSNPLNAAVLAARPAVGTGTKLAELPFDFVRKRVSVVIGTAEGARLITKGAFRQVLAVCSRRGDGSILDAEAAHDLQALYDRWSTQGIRVIAVGVRELPAAASYSRADERDMTFVGFLTFTDRPKAGVAEALAALRERGVAMKIITGDSALVARHVAALVGMRGAQILTGRDLDELSDDALPRAANNADLFAEVDPNQKERIILALKKAGHVVGFLGDGVNDAPAMHAADTSLSVAEAVDVARDAADFVLLERGLDVIRRGIDDGRRTFANTLKYILLTTSANLGNMISMALASLFLPFLPLLAGQILLNNFLSDIPAIGFADDDVDPEMVQRPERWNIAFIGRFMVDFGTLSSLFDGLTFAALLAVFGVAPAQFRSGWFVESLLTELVIALVVRTRRPFYRSRPGRLLLGTTVAMIFVTVMLPFSPVAGWIGLVPLPLHVMLGIVAITAAYVAAAEWLKARFYRARAAS